MMAGGFDGGHQLHLLQGGVEFFPALTAAMDAAQFEIRFETYIFHADASAEAVVAALVRAAQRGVSVSVLVDGVGTPAIPVTWQRLFAQAGVDFQTFAPLGRWGLLVPTGWRRLHRKLCAVDAVVAFCGGINVLDDWVDPSLGALESPRFDFAVRIQGPLVADVQLAMSQLWSRVRWKHQLEHLDFKSARRNWRALLPRLGKNGSQPIEDPGAQAALVLRDNLRNRNRIEKAYLKAIASARHEVLIANAYFLPGGKLRRALLHAARRGVRVRLLLQGRYEYFMQYHGARPVYGQLLAAGIEIYEYRVGFLHAKVAVVDGQWATVGSSNLDPLSLLLAREANVVVQDAGFAKTLRQRLHTAMRAHGTRLDAKTYAARPWHERLLDRVAFGMMRLGLFLTGKRY